MDLELRPENPSIDSEEYSKSRQSFRDKLNAARKRHGKAVPLEELESEGSDDPDSTVLWKFFARKITLHPGNIVKKTGRYIRLEEATALRVAGEARLPVPRVYSAQELKEERKNCMEMDYIQGKTLEKLWPKMDSSDKEKIVQQLRQIVDKMRSITPPPNLVGGCDGSEISDTREYSTYLAPSCTDEDGFNAYLLSSLAERTPPAVKHALARRLNNGHRMVLSHCDLAPRNIIVKDGSIQGIIDWEVAGWYPEYWEYVKFFQRGVGDGDWSVYADGIFSEKYPDELVDFMALSRWQKP